MRLDQGFAAPGIAADPVYRDRMVRRDKARLDELLMRLAGLQDRLYAAKRHKLLLVLHVFAVGLLIVKPKNPKRSRQMTGIVISCLVIIAISAILRQLHLN